MLKSAIIFTDGILNHPNAKTAHGLIRRSKRYEIIGVIDPKFNGLDAGEVLDRIPRNIPVYASVKDFQEQSTRKADFGIVGIALPGGKMPESLKNELSQAIIAGISIVSGLHDFLSEHDEFRKLAGEHNVELIDIRKPRPKKELKFWTGEIRHVKAPVIAILGTDCALGKRTTTSLLTQELTNAHIHAQMIFTGQTGWLQGYEYGFILDSTYNDFISGELENAVVNCYRETSPDVIILEGQSALCNPSGPCGAEYLLSAGAKAVILQHAPGRTYYNGHEKTGIKISLEREIALIRLYGSEVLAISLNTSGLEKEEIERYRQAYREKFGIPVVLPLQEIGALSTIVKRYIQSQKQAIPAI
ncbi:DUF1611 domain-containing protein [Dyadobacter sp. CY323]|uniref:DUF1611 domain-containing protein n=1 Tax=Dyadobacter sp. CY323 TaxID=2907302 RepID=UPI001F4122DC|nr:DUF1611 domain-containing protein [Dyadobacter sp. CY323]MCE6989779.1 DUF1611 domain-containing protein [Dyadobacter sp. CY323]